jgi:hypothetical protein
MSSGSFGLPPEMQAEIEKSKKKAAQKPVDKTDAESVIEDYDPPKKEKPEAPKVEDPKESYAKVKAEAMKDLEITLTDEDFFAYVFKNRLEKGDICILSGKLYAKFRSLSVAETIEIDRQTKRSSTIDYTEAGVRNFNTLHLLSHGVLEMGTKGKTKSLGATPEERYKAVEDMGSLVVEKISQKWNLFVFLVSTLMQEEDNVKKS